MLRWPEWTTKPAFFILTARKKLIFKTKNLSKDFSWKNKTPSEPIGPFNFDFIFLSLTPKIEK